MIMSYGFNPLTPIAWFTQAMQMWTQMQGFTCVSYPNANVNACTSNPSCGGILLL